MTPGSITAAIFAAANLLLVAFGQNAQPSPEEVVANLTRAHDGWGAKASSPGMSLTIKETSRSGPSVTLRLVATGAPKDAVFTLLAWPVTQRGPGEVLKGVTFDESGLAVCAGRPGTCGNSGKPNDPIDFPFRPAPGEPVRLAVVGEGGNPRLFAKLVPAPLAGDDRGCRVDATLLTPGAELLFVEGNGFPAGSEIEMASDSEGERHSTKGKADAAGRYASAILPYKQGVARGTININLKSSGCSPKVSVPWGKRAPQ